MNVGGKKAQHRFSTHFVAMLQNKLHVFVARLIIVTLGASENFSNETGDTNLSINIKMNERFPILSMPDQTPLKWKIPIAFWRSLCHSCGLFLNYLITFKDTNDATEMKLVLSMNLGLNGGVNITADTSQA